MLLFPKVKTVINLFLPWCFYIRLLFHPLKLYSPMLLLDICSSLTFLLFTLKQYDFTGIKKLCQHQKQQLLFSVMFSGSYCCDHTVWGCAGASWAHGQVWEWLLLGWEVLETESAECSMCNMVGNTPFLILALLKCSAFLGSFFQFKCSCISAFPLLT